ncbi:transmembrane emp24 domain-containing protein [Holotrichia oblita]|uniref:Transmembrane emp24 domain-containing protein n=1 Tax=Holotrichia oblita TaxID=644536 RepID=A0ACB9SZA4_HOLOL|nr:transmembrane emp24 domain-containing protein [Holotrichia oblita]
MVCIITLLTGSLSGKVYANFNDPKIIYSRVRIFSFFIECIEKYIVTITIMIFYNLVLSVKDKFNFINAKLAILNYKTDGDFTHILQAFSKAHYLLCEAVEYINDNFGYMLFGLILMISLDLIMGVNVVITLILHGDHNVQQNFPVVYTLLPSITTSILFLVVTGGQYDVDVTLEDPKKEIIYKQIKTQFDSHTFTAAHDGVYIVCFSNEFSTFSHKLVYMDLQVGDEQPLPGIGEHVTVMTQMESSAQDIHKALNTILDFQTHHRLRETQGRKRAEDLNERVLWWSCLETLAILTIGIGQVFVLRNFFTEKKPYHPVK